jgi:hypothetical protein
MPARIRSAVVAVAVVVASLGAPTGPALAERGRGGGEADVTESSTPSPSTIQPEDVESPVSRPSDPARPIAPRRESGRTTIDGRRDDLATDSRPKGHGADRHDGDDEEGAPDSALRLLDAATAKVTASTLADADKLELLGRISAVRDAGVSLGDQELRRLLSDIRRAVGAQRDRGDEPRIAHPDDAGKRPGQRAVSEIDRQIARIQASDLPDGVKDAVIAALDQVKLQLAAGAGNGSDGDSAHAARRAIEDHRRQRRESFIGRLTEAADRIDARLAELSADPANQTMVAEAQARLATAREQLVLATTPEDLRSAWELLREIRRSIRSFEQPTTTRDTEDTPVTDAPVPDTPVTDAPVPDTPVPDSPVTDAPVPDSPGPEPTPPNEY